MFPQAIARAATFDAALEERIGRTVATEARVSLKPGERRTVSIPVTARELAVYREDGTPFVPAGRHTAFVGGGQPGFAETREVAFEVDGKGEVP